MSDDYEAVMLVITEVNVYRIPPRQTSRGYRASDWDVTQHLWTGRLKITASSTKATIRFEDPTTGDLFAVCPYDPNGTSVEPVQDSSRYFVVRIVDQGSGQHAFVGVGFAERGWAFDFNVALQEFSTRFNRTEASVASTSSSTRKAVPEGPKIDYSLKEGQTISINLGNSSAKTPSRPQSTSAKDSSMPFLPPPPSAAAFKQQPQQQQSASTNDWTDFGTFVGVATSSPPQPQQQKEQQQQPWPQNTPQNDASSFSSVPSNWTTF